MMALPSSSTSKGSAGWNSVVAREEEEMVETDLPAMDGVLMPEEWREALGQVVVAEE